MKIANWYGNRYDERYEYLLISPTDWSEKGSYDYITSGTIEMSNDSTLKMTGSFSFEGTELPDPNYYMRVVYSFNTYDVNSDAVVEERVTIGTFIISFSSLTYQEGLDGMRYSGSINAMSILQILDDKKYGEPFIIKRNTNAIYKAFELISGLGLRCEYTPGSATITKDHVFDPDVSYLEIVNWLCDFSKYESASVSEDGVVLLQPKLKPEQDSSPIVFANDDNSIMYPELEEENDWQTRANVVKMVYNTDIAWAIATASNIYGSPMSLSNVHGREITLVEETADVNTSKNILEQLIQKAEEKLKEEANETEYVTFSHAYIPFSLNKAIRIKYSEYSWLGAADNISITLSPSTKTQTKIKKTIENVIGIEKSGEIASRE